MNLSRFSDYSLRVLMYAALKDDESFMIDEVTEAYGISRNHVAKVIHNLSKLCYLETRRGRGGGIRLACPASEIRLGKLVQETENQPVIVECFSVETNSCPISNQCRLKGLLAEAMEAFYESLNRYTLSDLVAGPLRKRLGSTLFEKA